MAATDLIIFDIDGTLLRTTEVDDLCFAQAAADVFGLPDINCDWSVYEHCTDVAIASQLVREKLCRECSDEDIAAFRSRFVELLQEAQQRDRTLFQEIPGAAQLLSHLRDSGTAACLATGGFQASARFKLRSAALECQELPAAFAEDGPSRQQVVTAAIHRAAALWTQTPNGVSTVNGCFGRRVSIGDGVWDVTTAAAMNLPFVGIAAGRRAEQLRVAGAGVVLADFADLDRTLDALRHAEVPR